MSKEIAIMFGFKDKQTVCLEPINNFYKLFEDRKLYNLVLLSSGRDALSLCLFQFKAEGRKKICLLPLYICGCIIDKFLLFNYEIVFYKISRNLIIDSEYFDMLVRKINPDVLFFQTYFGVDSAKNVRPFFDIYKNIGIVIIEDITNSIYSQNISCSATYYIGSLRKWYPIIDGGILISNKEIHDIPIMENSIFIRFKKAAMKKKFEYIERKNIYLKDQIFKINSRAENYLDSVNRFFAMSRESVKILSYIDVVKIKKIRTENYLFLYNNLKNCKFIKMITHHENCLPPLYFTFYVESNIKNQLKNILLENRISVIELWPIHNKVLSNLDKETKSIYNEMLAVSCDQRYDLVDMEKIVRVINSLHDKNI